MKIASVVGTRPEIIQYSAVWQELRGRGHTEKLIHTGQHYDDEMSLALFKDLGLPGPDLDLRVTSSFPAQRTGLMMLGLEGFLLDNKPDWVLVYGDTDSTLAGALTAAKLDIPVAHIEAGMRSFNRDMPEELNRVLIDHCSDLLFCPTETAAHNLSHGGIHHGVHLVGDVNLDAFKRYGFDSAQRSTILQRLGLERGRYLLATAHRNFNADDPERLMNILSALVEISEPIVFPVHPRTRANMLSFGLIGIVDFRHSNVLLMKPVGYLDMLELEANARMILTDSGGVQKEAYFAGVPCLTLRAETEWPETVEAGWNVLVDDDPEHIAWEAHAGTWPDADPPPVFGDGHASREIVRLLEEA